MNNQLSTKLSDEVQSPVFAKQAAIRIYSTAWIKRVFEKASDRQIAFTYLIKKVAELPKKSDRMGITNSLIDFLQNEKDELGSITIHNTGCSHCLGNIDSETGVCDNCG